MVGLFLITLCIGLVAWSAVSSAAFTEISNISTPNIATPNVADIVSSPTSAFESYTKGNSARGTAQSFRTGIFPAIRPNQLQWNCTTPPILTWGDRDNGGTGFVITNADSNEWQAFFIYHNMCDSVPFKHIWIGAGLTQSVSVPPCWRDESFEVMIRQAPKAAYILFSQSLAKPW